MKNNLLGNSDLRLSESISTRPVFMAIALAIAAFLSGCATAPKAAKAGKLYHVGLVWLKEPGNAEHRQKIIAAAPSFAREIPEVQFLSVGQTLPKTSSWADASFDICFVMRLEDKPAMDQMSNEASAHRSEEHTSELQSPCNLVCRLLLEKKKAHHNT